MGTAAASDIDLVYRIARVIWERRYNRPDDDTWDYVRFLAEDTEDGGNARYLLTMGTARAIVDELTAIRNPPVTTPPS